MSDLITLPWASRLVIGCLIAQPELIDDLEVPAAHIGTDIGHNVVPAIQITQFPGSIVEGGSIYWLEETLLQVTCHGPGGNDRYAAHRIAETARAILSDPSRFRGAVQYTIGPQVERGVVSGCVCGGIADPLDEAYTPARPYSHFDVVLTAHPLPTSGS